MVIKYILKDKRLNNILKKFMLEEYNYINYDYVKDYNKGYRYVIIFEKINNEGIIFFIQKLDNFIKDYNKRVKGEKKYICDYFISY